ncbi:MAG: hypothetical protein KatS3mg111_3760 [Pirellulaceae bacterium]|nr:MAG: hypothetical protein KatS3mg111_3760 [Pirellulaceae bacterium]
MRVNNQAIKPRYPTILSISDRLNPKAAADWWRGGSVQDDGNRPFVSSPIDDAAGDDEQAKLRRVEAVLFLAREELNTRKIAKLAALADATEARTLIKRLNAKYDQIGRAFRVEEIAGGYVLLTRPEFAPWLRKLQYVPAEKRLSQSAMETLAIVAYRQPVLRAEIEAIRGVGCSEVLKQLMELDLVRISGRSEELGRPYLYGTTRRFLQMFGLRSTDRLPRKEWVNELQNMVNSSPQTDAATSDEKESMVTQTSLTGSVATFGDELPSDSENQQEFIVRAIDDDDDYLDDDEDFEDDDFEDDEDDYDDEDVDDEDLEDADWDEVDDDEEDEDVDDDEEDEDDDDEESEWDDEDFDDEDDYDDDYDDDDWDEEDEDDDEWD